MNKTFISTLAGAALLSGSALAQFTEAPASTDKHVDLTPETIEEVRDYVGAQTYPPATVGADFTVETGAVLPAEVEMYAFEGIPDVAGYNYVVIEDRTVLVDPATREIVQVID